MNNFRIRIGLAIIFAFLQNSLFAQKSKIDSLLNIIKTVKDDSSIVSALNELFLVYEFTDSTKAKEYIFKAIDFSKKRTDENNLAKSLIHLGYYYEDKGLYSEAKSSYLKSLNIYKKMLSMNTSSLLFNTGIAKCERNIGIVDFRIGEYDSALVHLRKSLLLYNSIQDQNGSAKVLMNIGMIFTSQGKSLQALEYTIKALKIFESVKDEVYTYKCSMNVGVIHLYQKNYSQAVNYFNKTLVLAEQYNDRIVISNCKINLGSAYTKIGNLKSALDSYSQALKIREEIGDKSGIAAVLMNIANIYYYLVKFPEALDYNEKSLKIKKEIGDKDGMATIYLNIALIKENLDFDTEALSYLKLSIQIAKELNSLEIQKRCYETESFVYEKMNDLKNALISQKLFKILNDSIYNIESGRQFKEMESKYQNEKKQKEIELKEYQLAKKESEIKQQRTQKFAFISGFILMIILAGVVFKSYLEKKKANILMAFQKQVIENKNEVLNQQNEEICTQRDEILVQRDLVTEQKEQIEEIYKEISDSINYAKKIQQAMLPSGGYANNFLGDHFILFRPKDVVSGDFYWATKEKEYLIITVADCTGHGVPGAFMSMLGISFLNEIVRKKEVTQASHVLDQLRSSVVDALKQKGQSGEQKDGMDMVLVVINTDTLEMQFSGANNPLWIVKKLKADPSTSLRETGEKVESNEVDNNSLKTLQTVQTFEFYEVKGDKMPVAIHERMESFTNNVIQLHKGDTLYLASDGYEDQFGGEKRKKFLAKNMKELIRLNSYKPMNEQREILENTIVEWIGKGEQIDDITVMGIKV